jgi:hypothetical protein
MTRNLKVLGLALVAVMAMSAVVASAASAGTAMTKNSNYPVAISAEQIGSENHVFTSGAGNEVKCKKASFSGTASAASSNVTVHPSYSECTAFGLAATVTTTGCDYEFTIGATIGAGPNYDGTVKLVCSGTNKILIQAGAGQCEVRIGDENTAAGAVNQSLSTVSFENKTSPEHVIVDASVTGINYDVTVDKILGPLKAGEANDGTYNGSTTTSATFEGKAEGVTVEM